ncbi:B910 protein, partial [Loxia curvirostra]|nr:B910 protein [Loxia curvirostra]NXH05979.1 B910 protein [Loxia leucoptera]
MKDEIAATVFFITKLAKREDRLSKHKMEKFAARLTTLLFEKYKGHWYLDNPSRGQAFRCIRINRQRAREPLLEQACQQSDVDFQLLGLPQEMTLWVDPFQVCCRYGERSRPFTVAHFGGQESPELPQQISLAVGRAALDYPSSTSSDEESFSQEPRAIPTVSNPNSIYQFGDFCKAPPQPWWQYLHRKPHLAEGSQHRGYRTYRPTFTFTGPRVDRYHWINTKR